MPAPDPTLSPPDALARLQAGAGEAWAQADRQVLARIADELDGHPVLLDAAAALAALFDPAASLARAAAGQVGHPAIDAWLGATWADLSEPGRTTWALWSAGPALSSAPSLEAVVGTSGLEGLSALLSTGVATRVGDRFRLGRVAARLVAGRRPAGAANRWAEEGTRTVLAALTASRGPSPAGALTALDPLRGDLERVAEEASDRPAATLLAALARTVQHREQHQLALRALARVPDDLDALLARADAERGLGLFDALGETLARLPQDPPPEAAVLAAMLTLDAEPDVALAAHRDAIAQCAGHPWLEARARANLGSWRRRRDELEEALQQARAAFGIAEAHGLATTAVRAQLQIAIVQHQRGQTAEALAVYGNAADRAQQTDQWALETLARQNLGVLALETREWALAEQALARAVELATAGGEHELLAQAATNQAVLAALTGRWPDAESRFRDVLAVLPRRPLRPACYALVGLACAAAQQGRDAQPLLDQARAEAEALQDSLGLALVELNQTVYSARLDPALRPQAEEALAAEEAQGVGGARLGAAVARTLLPDRPAWTVAPDGSSFRAPGEDAVSLGRRRAAKRLLVHLVEAHRDRPRQALDTQSLFEAGWPGESIRPESAVHRVHVAIASLRKLGLTLLVTGDEGYLLDPAEVVSSEP